MKLFTRACSLSNRLKPATAARQLWWHRQRTSIQSNGRGGTTRAAQQQHEHPSGTSSAARTCAAGARASKHGAAQLCASGQLSSLVCRLADGQHAPLGALATGAAGLGPVAPNGAGASSGDLEKWTTCYRWGGAE